MAADAPIYPSTPCLTIFFSLLVLLSHFTMAVRDNSFILSPSNSSTKAVASNRNYAMLAASRREATEEKLKTDLKQKESSTNGITVPDQLRSVRPLPWQNSIFNASEHEVPSGPNPISNR